MRSIWISAVLAVTIAGPACAEAMKVVMNNQSQRVVRYTVPGSNIQNDLAIGATSAEIAVSDNWPSWFSFSVGTKRVCAATLTSKVNLVTKIADCEYSLDEYSEIETKIRCQVVISGNISPQCTMTFIAHEFP